MNELAKTIEEIKSLKIQGATNITIASLRALLSLSQEEIPEAIEDLISARPTEPLFENCLNLVRTRGKLVILPTLDRLQKDQVL